jgi:hypothetical protein
MTSDQGICQRDPPKPFIIGMVDTPNGKQPATVNIFPTITLMSGWCGEYTEEPKIAVVHQMPGPRK